MGLADPGGVQGGGDRADRWSLPHSAPPTHGRKGYSVELGVGGPGLQTQLYSDWLCDLGLVTPSPGTLASNCWRYCQERSWKMPRKAGKENASFQQKCLSRAIRAWDDFYSPRRPPGAGAALYSLRACTLVSCT